MREHSSRTRFTTLSVGLFLVVGSVVPGLARPDSEASAGATFTVDITADVQDASPGDGVCATAGGQCSLRGAIQETNALAGADSIMLAAGTYALTIDGTGEDAAATGDLDITDDLTIVGNGANDTIIDGSGIDRVVHVIGSPVVELTDLTVRGGGRPETGDGGGIRNDGGTLTLNRAIVSDNVAPAYPGGVNGGGIFNTGALTVSRSSIIDNAAREEGGGIYNRGILTIAESTISNNTASGLLGGGGIANHEGDLEITSSTLSDNTDAGNIGFGGGIQNYAGTGTLTNTTISGNHGTGQYSNGGGIANLTATFGCIPSPCIPPPPIPGVLTLTNVTVSNNSVIHNGGGIFNDLYGTVTLRNTIVANNPNGGDCSGSGSTSSAGHNLDSDASCNLSMPGDIPGADPLLGLLANNGGPTQTHALASDSPAIDAGNPATPGSGGAACPADDQRGIARPSDGDGDGSAICDIGSYEREDPSSPVGGIAELPVTAQGDSSARNFIALAGFVSAAALLALTAGAWYARRRWLG